MASSTGRTPTRRSGGGDVLELQRSRLLEAAFAVVAEQGYRGLTARKVIERAGVSPRTFYELFSDREACFLAAFEQALEELAAAVLPAYESEREWTARVRAGLAALLGVLDWEPALRRLVFVEALAAGLRVLERRARVLEQLTDLVDEGRADMEASDELPAMTAEGVVGAAFSVLHARLLQERSEPLIELLNPLMATIALPFRGSTAAARELARPAPEPTVLPLRSIGVHAGRPLGSIAPVDFRLTIRTQMVLGAVAGHEGVNNRGVSELVGVADQGQISRLMTRLQAQGLIEDTRGYGRSAPKAWRVTRQGEAVIDAHRGGRALIKREHAGHGGKLAAKRGAPKSIASMAGSPASGAFRLTARTHLVLTAIAQLRERGSTPSNREVAQAAGITDQAQVSRMLRRLQGHGLLANTSGATVGISNAWHLTPRGEELLHSTRALGERAR
jgi:AcrR family transcriptional regulator/DNA-binding MarR family transcriptional regulator